MKNLKTNIHSGIVGFGFLAFSLLQTSCTSLQQSTAAIAKDDLYDAPASQVYKEVQDNTAAAEEEQYQEYQNYQDDRFLRLKVANRNRWSTIDDFGYWNNPSYRMSLTMGYGMGFGRWGYGNIGFGWGGWNNWGWDPWFGGFGGWGGWGWDPWMTGFGPWGFGGFGGPGFGLGWNPYFAGYWNPYRPIYYGGGYYGGIGFPNNSVRLRERIPMQPSRTNLAGYNNNRNMNGTGFRPNGSFNNGSRNINSANLNSNSFSNLVKRAVTSNANYNNSRSNNTGNLERPTRFSNNNFNSAPVRSNSSPSFNSGGGTSGGSGGGGFVGGGRRGGGGF